MEIFSFSKKILKQINNYCYEIPSDFRDDMKVPARIFVDEMMIETLLQDKSLLQLINVSTLPGIQVAAFAMPDIHQGYGFPIGGVAATNVHENGVISPGGIGYDINCGIRLLSTNLTKKDLEKYKDILADKLFHVVPSGVGRGGKIKLTESMMDKILQHGAKEALNMGFGEPDDILTCEEQGNMQNADPSLISEHAKKRALDQLGTLGSGNHFLEVQMVEQIFNKKIAEKFSLKEDCIAIMIHCGSRGLGHQTCTDYVRIMDKKSLEWGYHLPDRELMCAPFFSSEGQQYFSAMAAAANFAWANRHVIASNVKEVFKEIFGTSTEIKLVYDLSHNIGKLETHMINGKNTELLVHRKGATRAFPAGHKEVPEFYREIGHPVLIPGTMGTASYVLVGNEQNSAFFSACHGAGRLWSRAYAKKTVRGSELRKILESRGISIRSDSDPGLAEEAPEAYKAIEKVVEIVYGAHLAKPIARLVPLAVIKG